MGDTEAKCGKCDWKGNSTMCKRMVSFVNTPISCTKEQFWFSYMCEYPGPCNYGTYGN